MERQLAFSRQALVLYERVDNGTFLGEIGKPKL